jgi:hypothetical protein
LDDAVVFLTGVGLVEAAVEGLMGVVFVAVAAGLSFFMAVGRGFLAAAAVGFDAVLTGVFAVVTGVFLIGVEVVAGLLVEPVGKVFCVPSGVLALTGVALADVGAFG